MESKSGHRVVGYCSCKTAKCVVDTQLHSHLSFLCASAGNIAQLPVAMKPGGQYASQSIYVHS